MYVYMHSGDGKNTNSSIDIFDWNEIYLLISIKNEDEIFEKFNFEDILRKTNFERFKNHSNIKIDHTINYHNKKVYMFEHF